LQWAKVMAWRLSGNWENELFHAQLLAEFGEEAGTAMIADLQPAYDYQNRPIIVPSDVTWERVPAGLAGLRRLDAIAGPRGRSIGSNSWVVAGSRTTTGMPLLANDPHLGYQMPALWYFNSIHCDPVGPDCPFEAVGASLPGVPGIILGHNARIAWGATNVGPDVQDLFLEKVTGNQYEFQGKMVDLEIVPEVFTIKGKLPDDYGPSANETSTYDPNTNTTTITLNVRTTRHGPLISDVHEDLAQLDYPVAFAWTAINAPEKTLDSFLGINRAQNWEEFRAALSVYGTPSQNFVYADVDGNIGYQMPGRVPVRASGDGQLPVPGWTGEHEWTGYIPFEELPFAYNPAQGYLATANNGIVGPDYPHFISMEWDRGYRAQRIVDLIEAKDQLSPDDFAAIQGDSLNLSAQDIVPFLSSLTVEGDAQKVLDAIRAWDFHEQQDSAGAGAYQAFWLHLLRNTFDDELGDLARDYVDGSDVNRQAITLLLAQPDSRWWDNVNSTGVTEARDDILKKSLTDAAQALSAEFGGDPASWAWGKLHTVTFASQALGASPVAFIFNRGPFAVSGGTALVNNNSGSFSRAYPDPDDAGRPLPKLVSIFWVRSGPSLRQIVDLSDLNASRFIHTTGQSGLPYHPHYDDMIDLWRNVQYVPMRWDRTDIEKNAEGTL
ncbi:MAG: penicillin acylase family protein, partial [Anaerolineae bacterium]